MKRSGIERKAPMARVVSTTKKAAPAPRARLRSKQLAVTDTEKVIWSKLAALGCVACRADGNFNPHVSIHHVDGRTKPGCHMLVLALCSGHHQASTGEDKTLLAIHPWKARWEKRYGSQMDLVAENMKLIGETK